MVEGVVGGGVLGRDRPGIVHNVGVTSDRVILIALCSPSGRCVVEQRDTSNNYPPKCPHTDKNRSNERTMCGIFAVFGLREGTVEEQRRLVIKQSKLIRHRGPDQTGVYHKVLPDGSSVFMTHERLIVVDTTDAGK